MGEQRNQCGLTHVSGFPAHIWTGNDQHALSFIQDDVVWRKGIRLRLFDHRMPTSFDKKPRLTSKAGGNPVETQGTLCQGIEDIELRQRAGAIL